MKSQLQLLTRSIHQHCSFSLAYHTYQFLKIWHYHPELELVFIQESTGTRYVGDSIENFSPGEIVLLGKNLPHLWLNDKEYIDKGSTLKSKAIVIHFMENFSDKFLQVPEMECIRKLFEKANRGIKFRGDSNELILQKLNEMQNLKDLDRVIKLIEILRELSNHNDYKLLSSNCVDPVYEKVNNKIDRVNNYILCNFKNNISLNDAAKLVHMNSSSFSRYFKQVQKKTFTQYVNEIKIGYACQLFIEQDYNIAEVCYESGFKNLSNFNRQFKEIKKVSPTGYIKSRAEIH
jgi:AraC-like DNA-binding protein